MTSPFEQAFPGFVQATVDLYRALLPWSIPVVILGFLLDFWHGVPTPGDLMKALIKVFLVFLLLAKSHVLVNEGQLAVKSWLERNISARPEKVADRFKERLRLAQESQESKDQTFIGQLLDSRSLFEAIIFATLTLIAWLAMAIMAFVYSVQRAVLLGCWALSPLFVPLIAIRPLSHLGLRHILRIIGIILWPVGLALAATFSDGLIEVISSGTSFSGASTAEALGRGLTSLLGLVVLAIWIIFSSFLAPLIIQRLILGTEGPARLLGNTGNLLASSVPQLASLTSSLRLAGTYTQAASIRVRDWLRHDRPGDSRDTPSAHPTIPPPPMPSTMRSGIEGASLSSTEAEQAAQRIADKARKG